MFVDSHCHLNFPQLSLHLDRIRCDMSDAKVDAALCICTTIEEFPQVYQLATEYANFWATAGVHPDSENVVEPSQEELARLALKPRVVAIGETGLDYFRLGDRQVKDMEWQRERFRRHIRAGISTARPLVIHTRQASDDTLAILKEEGAERAGGVFHCFTESVMVARAALDLGFYISFSGILTFKSATELHAVAKFVPIDRCLIETDSPYLAPTPHRGKTNTPAFVPLVAQKLADLRAETLESVAQATTENFYRCFPLACSGD